MDYVENSIHCIRGTLGLVYFNEQFMPSAKAPKRRNNSQFSNLLEQLWGTEIMLCHLSSKTLEAHRLLLRELDDVVGRAISLVMEVWLSPKVPTCRREHYLEEHYLGVFLDLRWWTWVIIYEVDDFFIKTTSFAERCFVTPKGVLDPASSRLPSFMRKLFLWWSESDGKVRHLPSYRIEVSLRKIGQIANLRLRTMSGGLWPLSDIRFASAATFLVEGNGLAPVFDARKPLWVGDELKIDLTQVVLGVSHSGLVIKCKDSGTEYALKRVDSSLEKKQPVLARLFHPHIVQLMDYWSENGFLFLVMELMEGDLEELIARRSKGKILPFMMNVAVDILLQLAKAMLYLHDMGVTHPHLKSSDVLFQEAKDRSKLGENESYYLVKLGEFRFYTKNDFESVGRNVYQFGLICLEVLSEEPTQWESVEPIKWFDAIHCRHEYAIPESLTECIRRCLLDGSTKFSEIVGLLLLAQLQVLTKATTESSTGRPGKSDHASPSKQQDLPSSSGSFSKSTMSPEGEFNRNEVVSVIPCPCGRELELLPRSPYKSGPFICNMCFEEGDGEMYHCETCQFDAHPNCAEIKDTVHVFFHDHPLHLLVQNYYSDDPDVTCRLCGESVQDSAWVYRCEQCEFDVHALCTKYPRELILKRMHAHSLRLIQCPPHKSLSCTCCTGKVRGSSWRYTCTEKWCPFELHLSCYTRYLYPLCIFDISHRLSLHMYVKGFHCGKCGALGFSSFYHCDKCDVDIHLECLDDMVEEEHYWIGVYEKLMLGYGSKDYHSKTDTISKLMEGLFMSESLRVNSSSSSTVPLEVTMREQPSIQRLTPSEERGLDAFDDVNVRKRINAETVERKAKKRAAKEARQKLKENPLEMLENLERIILDMESSMNMSQADAEVLVATHEKLKKGRYIVQAEVAKQVQSKIRQGPRICVFYARRKGGSILELLTSLRADMKDVEFELLCEEPGHEHIVQGSKVTLCNGVLGEERLGNLQPLLSSGLQVVARAMGTLAGQQPQLDCVTLPTLGTFRWDLRAMDLEKRSRAPFEEEENVEALKRAEDSAAEWMLSDLEYIGGSIYEERGLLRIRYLGTEVGDCPRYTRGSLAWLCADHFMGGFEADRLEPYPVKYYNEQR